MDMEQILASIGLSGLAAEGFFVTQIGVLTLTGILFVASLALCIMAVRAVWTVKRVQAEVRDIAGEMRQLTAQVERSGYVQNHANRQADADEQDSASEVSNGASLGADEKDIGDDKRKKTGSSALLRGFLSRR